MPARQPPIRRPPLKSHGATAAPAAPTGGLFVLVTCEHGGKHIPPEYQEHFAGYAPLLDSHRGHDPGALVLAQEMAAALDAPLVAATTSRLLVDLNRSPGHPRRYSEITRPLPHELRAHIHAEHYQPYRDEVEKLIATAIGHGATVVHLSSHSFTPIMDGRLRNADAGFLYDPARPGEVALCQRWLAALHARAPRLRLRRNYPYTGRSDGFCTWLRRRYPAEHYIGVELELNQRHATTGGPAWTALRADVVAALQAALHDHPTLQVHRAGLPGAESAPAGERSYMGRQAREDGPKKRPN